MDDETMEATNNGHILSMLRTHNVTTYYCDGTEVSAAEYNALAGRSETQAGRTVVGYRVGINGKLTEVD